MNKWVREDLKSYEPYNASAQPFPIVLDANESPWGLTETVRDNVAAWFANAENLNRYPDTNSTELREALASLWGLLRENIVCGVGSDQLIEYITKALLMPGDTLVTMTPSFSMYKLTAKLNHGRVEEFPLNADYTLDADGFIRFAKVHNAKLVILCTPNNPTGGSIPEADLLRIAAALDCPVVVDEAYAEFGQDTVIPHIGTYDNLLVLRTFSKAYGLAGARIGYAVAQKELADALHIVRAPYNLPTLSQRLAIEVLRDMEAYKERIETLRTYKDELFEKLSGLEGIHVFPSDANFIYIETERNISESLERHGIHARVFLRGEKEKVRLSCGTPLENEAAIQAIRESVIGG